MSRYKTPKPKPRVIVRTIDELLVLLRRYRGGKIVKGKHPIHCKVVELERLLRVVKPEVIKRAERTGFRKPQSQKLPLPLLSAWFRMLWASRNRLVRQPGYLRVLANLSIPNAQHAMGWRDIFVKQLEQFREMVKSGEYQRLYDSRDGEVIRVFDWEWKR